MGENIIPPLSKRFFSTLPFKKFQNSKVRNVVLVTGAMTMPFLPFVGYVKALETEEKKEQGSDEEDSMNFERCEHLLKERKFDEAEELALKTLRSAEERDSMHLITYGRELMAAVAMEKGEFSKAEEILSGAINLLLSIGYSKENNDVIFLTIEMTNNLVTKASQETDANKAKVWMTVAHDGYRLLKKKLLRRIDVGAKHEHTYMLLSMVYEGVAEMYSKQGILMKARSNYEKAISWGEKGFGGNMRLITLINGLYNICMRQYNVPVAIYYLEKAIELARKSGDQRLADMLVKYGFIQMLYGHLDQALKTCGEGLDLSRKAKNGKTASDAEDCLNRINSQFL
ncbi:tetratricopeptide repeat protein 19 homolog, mitochondrial-like [Cloeon dipterum]|uniref:tetratricopeptide repeat protein 19 homolog, mitochondrial-like n=1 Tax=Cloeon dipterum TaxID=197152 RepID=UPI003220961F